MRGCDTVCEEVMGGVHERYVGRARVELKKSFDGNVLFKLV